MQRLDILYRPPTIEDGTSIWQQERCLNWHADPNELTEQLQRVGFRVEQDAVDYSHAIAKEQ